jgi:UDP-N-acetylmuramoyl-L-alanyl-D-glutamate--2,6-diaminopimelate ligase
VTGTNGKTTVTSMVASIVAATGELPVRVTTVGAWVGEDPHEAGTLEEFAAVVQRARQRGATVLAVETTSKALQDGFASRCPPDVAVFTNLTRDHLDLHGSPEAYLAAKAQLFLALRPGGHAVLCADDPASALLREVVPEGVQVWTYSSEGRPADLGARDLELSVGRSRCRLVGVLSGELELAVTGEVHVQNALGAALAAKVLGLGPEAIVAGLRAFPGVPGRFEVVSRRPLAVVDYAHTASALSRTLATARRLVTGQIVLVFGCGGERDAGKRPEMGRCADEGADIVLLTTDNPRREDPAQIARQVQEGARARARWRAVPDRREAIAQALSLAGPHDLVIVAGKGHETTQEVAGQQLSFSDREEVLRVTAGGDRGNAWTSS